ncbi:DUF4179 domain-containing protein [Paenibacillus harenae]|uniref:DUF4179 domain-containing protein n=1 Tax=Paenibacillus harenae TaxID=306543 RepID=A0ABT9U688_PAEHA|nr:DUF4179 domain-containing protein [Paenibacillus harenae]MDQ0113954.1 hypothetical protein [Paenibacillus harenae]
MNVESRIRQAKPAYLRANSDQAAEAVWDKLQQRETALVQKRSRIGRVSIAVAAAAAVIICLIGSGFVSPIMASALKQLPLIGGLFGQAGDAGLQTVAEQGMIQNVNTSVTHNGVTFTISDMMYDGTRISMVLTRETSDGNNPPLKKWVDKSTDTYIAALKKGETPSDVIEVRANGEKLAVSRHLASDIMHHYSSILTIQPDVGVTGSSSFDLPEQFEFEVKIQDATINQEFKLGFPVTKTTNQYIVLASEKAKSHGDYDMSISKLEMTEATMQMEVRLDFKAGQEMEAIGDHLGYDVLNERGELATLLGGSSAEGTDEKSYVNVLLFEPFKELPKTLFVKPYVQENKEKVYIKELEFTLSVQ